ncbi:hypothetical protein RhiJN_19589 [Ceratobasidium sp. AG-Ba]|nr:hypothetical protein RhiJN_04756 [Ceratobasidium sp. AG-Ba]QRV91571.1 hypothetical protein RhiJN_19589 [Ceratobasidium sp. AG-Ba]
MSFIRRKNSYEAVPVSETQPLVVGLDEQARLKRRRCRRRCCHFFFALIAMVFVGYGIFAFVYARSHVECVPYEGPVTTIKLPIYYPRSAVLVDSSVSSGDVAITHVESESNEITFTIEEKAETPEDPKDPEDPEDLEAAQIRLCTLKGGKLTGLGIYPGKKEHHAALPIIKSLKIEVPSSIPPPSISLLPPRRGCHAKAVQFMKWVGVWN